MGASAWAVWCWGLAWPGEVVLGLLVSRLGSYWFCPGWDLAYFAAEAEDVAGPGGFLRVIIVNTVVVGTQHR